MNILRAIRRQRLVDRAYANGYDQGRFDERMEIASNDLPCPCHPDCQECNSGTEETSDACGCVEGMGHMDRNCHSYGLCRSNSRRGRGLIVECRRCKGEGWTGRNDPRPGVTCDDCNGTGEIA